MKDLNEQLKNIQVPTDQGLVTHWLCTMRWHEYVARSGLSIDQLHQSIKLPQRSKVNYKGIPGIIERYFQQGLNLLDSTDELVLQCINSTDPTN